MQAYHGDALLVAIREVRNLPPVLQRDALDVDRSFPGEVVYPRESPHMAQEAQVRNDWMRSGYLIRAATGLTGRIALNICVGKWSRPRVLRAHFRCRHTGAAGADSACSSPWRPASSWI